LTYVGRSGIIVEPNSSYQTYQNITTDCDKKGTISMKSNGTFEEISYSDTDCVTEKKRYGTWSFRDFYGGLIGEIKYNNTTRNYEFHEGETWYTKISSFSISHADNNPPANMKGARLSYYYTRVN
jgi:hypothetical protein